ncbi:unnamed protein product [Durusdinium trenchii]|uniref:Uncharacterized protein n=1 Tax=Durusdinium trenchii TaxID=1381693 RepID=A0ABP0L3E9_9DINO
MTEQIARNTDKLNKANRVLESQERKLAAALRVFMYRRPVHFRQMFLALFRKYLSFLTQMGKESEKTLELIKADLHVGCQAQIVGLQKSIELNGQLATVVDEEEGGARLLVELQDGQQKSVRIENLCPADALRLESPASGSVAALAAAPAADVAASTEESPRRGEGGRLRLDPPRVPCSGGEVEVEVENLAGSISEVLVNGARCQILQSFPRDGRCVAQIEVPAISDDEVGGACDVEVRSASWHRHVVREPALNYFPLMSFIAWGPNIDATSSRPGRPSDVATRRKGLISAVAVTSELKPLPVAPAGDSGHSQRFYFEVEVESLAEKRTNRTLALGFVWQLPHAILLGPESLKRPASLWTPDGQMPEQALQLPRSFVLGGDPPKAYLAGREVAKLSWRPLLEVALKNTLGVFLEMQTDRLIISIFQDGELKCTNEAPVPEDWKWPSLGSPHGLLDVAGTVTALKLRHGAEPPVDAVSEGDEPPEPSPLGPPGGPSVDEKLMREAGLVQWGGGMMWAQL